MARTARSAPKGTAATEGEIAFNRNLEKEDDKVELEWVKWMNIALKVVKITRVKVNNPLESNHAKSKLKTPVGFNYNIKHFAEARKRNLNPSRIKKLSHQSWTMFPKKTTSKALYLLPSVLFREKRVGPVVQFGMNAAFAMRKSRVQIPPGPLPLRFKPVKKDHVAKGSSCNQNCFPKSDSCIS